MNYTIIDGFRVEYHRSGNGHVVAVLANLTASAPAIETCWTQGNEGDAISEARWLISEIRRKRALAKQGEP